jgi:hypothetical protein
MDPFAYIVLGIFIILWACAAIIPSMQRKREEQKK